MMTWPTGRRGPGVPGAATTNKDEGVERHDRLGRLQVGGPRCDEATQGVPGDQQLPRSWKQPNPATVRRYNHRFARPRVRVINWYGRSDDHPEWFVADGVHLSTAGQRAFVRTINRAVVRKGLG